MVIDSANVDGTKLELLSSGPSCTLRVAGTATMDLVPKAPCYFLRRASAGIQRFPYTDLGVSAVVILVGTSASQTSLEKWNIPSGMACGEETQAILFKRGQVVVSKAIHRGGVTCRDTGADEKEFRAFAESER